MRTEARQNFVTQEQGVGLVLEALVAPHTARDSRIDVSDVHSSLLFYWA